MKKHKGFTIMEVLIAMSILVSSIFVLTNLQIRSVFRVLRDRDAISRLFLVKKAFYISFYGSQKSNKPVKETIEEPETKVVTEFDSIDKKSESNSLAATMRFLKAKGNWESNGKKREMMMLSFIGNPEQEKERK